MGKSNFLQFTDEYDMVPQGATVLCALSGGADSMCLLTLLLELQKNRPFTLFAVHYNHHLRGEEAQKDAAFVADWCKSVGVFCVVGEGDVAGAAKANHQGLEETARSMRYAFLAQSARELGATRIATAHNADDNLETMLLHLVRGSGLRGLTGIPPRRGSLVRPLLTTSRAEIEEELRRRGIPHVEDATNADPAYSRNKLRLEVIPLLRELNPQLTRCACETIRCLRTDNSFLTAAAEQAASAAIPFQKGLAIHTSEIARQPDAIAPRVVQLLWERLHGEGPAGRAVHLDAVVALARGKDSFGELHLPGNLRVSRRGGILFLGTPPPEVSAFEPVTPVLDGETLIPDTGWSMVCRRAKAPEVPPKSRLECYIDPRSLTGRLILRPRLTGDIITLPHRKARTVKRLLIDAKVPRELRQQLPVLADDNGLVALAGFGPEESRLAMPGCDSFHITFLKKE